MYFTMQFKCGIYWYCYAGPSTHSTHYHCNEDVFNAQCRPRSNWRASKGGPPWRLLITPLNLTPRDQQASVRVAQTDACRPVHSSSNNITKYNNKSDLSPLTHKSFYQVPAEDLWKLYPIQTRWGDVDLPHYLSYLTIPLEGLSVK